MYNQKDINACRFLNQSNRNHKLYTMQKGTVKFFNATKGFGFIVPEDGGAEIFVHSSGLKEPIRENDTVSYEVADGKKGLNAVNVRKS